MDSKQVLSFCLAALVLCLISLVSGEHNPYANGWGDDIEWVSDLNEAKRVAAIRHHPIMLLIHQKWCGACKSLKGKLSESEEFAEASKELVMLNLEGDDESIKGREFSPDGSYIPRILFLDPTGKIRTEVINKQGNMDYQYYYARTELLINSMKEAVESFHIKYLTDTEDTQEPFIPHDEI